MRRPNLTRRRARRAAAVAASCLAVAALGGATAGAGSASDAAASKRKPPPPKPKVVEVADFFFGPGTVTLKKGGSINWKWASTNTQPHDVHLKSGPKGLKQKGSYSTKTTAVTGAQFKKTFDTPGTYKFICTIHPTQMRMTVTVKK